MPGILFDLGFEGLRIVQPVAVGIVATQYGNRGHSLIAAAAPVQRVGLPVERTVGAVRLSGDDAVETLDGFVVLMFVEEARAGVVLPGIQSELLASADLLKQHVAFHAGEVRTHAGNIDEGNPDVAFHQFGLCARHLVIDAGQVDLRHCFLRFGHGGVNVGQIFRVLREGGRNRRPSQCDQCECQALFP